MEAKKVKEKRECPHCGSEKKQQNMGVNRSGTQRRICGECRRTYTIEPKTREYPAEVQKQAMQMMLEGMSGRAIGRILGMSKANVYNWAKKNQGDVDKS